MSALDTAAVLASAGAAVRANDIAGGRAILKSALAEHPNEQTLLAFAGLLACGAGDLRDGITLLRSALTLQPADATTRRNLVRALMDSGDMQDAEAVGAGGDPADARLRRLLGYLRQARGEHQAAADDYTAVVAAFPNEGASWNNLGNALAELAEPDRAEAAFDRAIAWLPDEPAIRINAVKALARLDRRIGQLRLARAAADRFPDDAEIRYELALALATARDVAGAEAAFLKAIALDPSLLRARIELGMLYENLNRLDALDMVVADAEVAKVGAPEIAFLRAWALRRRDDFAGALPLAQAVPETVDPSRRNHLLGDLLDRLGDPDGAFAAFERMNAATAVTLAPAIVEASRRYLGRVRREPAEIAALAKVRPPLSRKGGVSPVFIAGFPRSGTTLLDTMLMNVPGLHVTEELPMMVAVEAALGDRSIAMLDEDEVAALRRVYAAELDRLSPAPSGAVIVDKHPLHMARMGLIHRLFPDAKILFAERHPCDVLLSCFVSNFQPNSAMAHFLTLEGAATLYDAVFEAWSAACTLLPLDVHEVRYERVVADTTSELKALIAFLGRDWDDNIVDNQASAAKRAHIRTASYAQVTEPIYTRSAGRWRRYERQLAPVLPVLARWAERMGYPL